MPHIIVSPCLQGDLLPLSPEYIPGIITHTASYMPQARVGEVLVHEDVPQFRVVGVIRLPRQKKLHGCKCLLLEALQDQTAGERLFESMRSRCWTLAWVTLSDKGSKGQRKDESGPLMAHEVRTTLPLCLEQGYLIPDDSHQLRALVTDLALTQGFDLILTCGGTGVGPRDITPETLLPMFEKRLEGFEQAMRIKSLSITPHAAISRAVAGTLGQALIISLPGSRKAVAENLTAILPILNHTLEKLNGDPSDCGSV